MKICQLEICYYAQKSFTYVAEALTQLLRLLPFHGFWHVTHINKISQFPTLVAAHQAEVCGPPVSRGPQVENCWTRQPKWGLDISWPDTRGSGFYLQCLQIMESIYFYTSPCAHTIINRFYVTVLLLYIAQWRRGISHLSVHQRVCLQGREPTYGKVIEFWLLTYLFTCLSACTLSFQPTYAYLLS